jgi:acyl carrier protein
VAQELASLFPEALGIDPPGKDVDLIEGGVIDSLALVELLFAIERRFGIEIPPDRLEVERFRTIGRLADLVTECGAMREAS